MTGDGSPKAAQQATGQSVLAKLEAIAAAELHYPPPLLLSANLAEEVAPDSLAKLTLVLQIENQFGICVPDDEAAELVCVGDAVALIERQLANKAQAAATGASQ